jgi:hypothetical protein
MKNILNLIILFALLVTCSKKEEVRFEGFSPEAFAYDLGNSWEVNATVNVRGFKIIEISDELSASLDFSVDLINSKGDTLTNILSDSKEVKEKEINYLQIEAQFELDTTNVEGKYKIIFNIKDNNSNNSTSAEIEVDLEE